PGDEARAESGLSRVGRRPLRRHTGTPIMIRFAAVLTLVLSTIACANALKPTGAPARELTLVADGKAIYSIVIPSKPTTEEGKAADDLRQWLREMTGAD